MKKILVLASAMFLGLAAQSAVTWDWWFGNASTSNRGCALGLGAANAEITGAQVAIGYSQVDTLRNGVQSAFIAKARKAALQFGLICFNEGGFLPVFVFFNFDKSMFGAEK